MITPAQIAQVAWDARHDQSPDQTIREELGIHEGHPRLATHVEADVWGYYACLDAFWRLVQRQGGYEAAMPDNRYRRLHERQERVEFVCPCGAMRLLPVSEAEDRKYCSRECPSQRVREREGAGAAS